MWIKRELEEEVKKISIEFPVIVITGPRQVGKTAIVEKSFPDYLYVSLDSPALAEMAETMPEEFLRRFPPPAVLDEIQYAPAIFRHIKQYVDQHREQNGLFILSGSQNFVLMQSVTESLAGRTSVIPLLGLSGLEWKRAFRPSTSTWKDWFTFLWKGSFPGLWKDPKHPPSRDRWYQGYVATYLERDVRNLIRIGRLRDFERFLRACAVRAGSILNMSDIGRDVGISATTSKEWISILCSSGQLFLLEPYFKSLGKRLVKSPKLYFTDTGLLAYLLGFQTMENIMQSPYAGALWENYCINQWIRWRDWHAPSAGLWFWRDRTGNEVDLILEIDQKLIPIECKFKEHPDKADIKAIKKLKKFYGEDQVSKAFIACLTKVPFMVAPDVMAISGWTIWDIGK